MWLVRNTVVYCIVVMLMASHQNSSNYSQYILLDHNMLLIDIAIILHSLHYRITMLMWSNNMLHCIGYSLQYPY